MTDTTKQDPHAELMRLADEYSRTTAWYVVGSTFSVQYGTVNEAMLASRADLDAYASTLTDRIAALEAGYSNACKLVADMHLAAVGEVKGPNRGVVEDVADLRAERDALAAQLEPVGAGGVGAMVPKLCCDKTVAIRCDGCPHTTQPAPAVVEPCQTCKGRGYTDPGDPETGATGNDYPCHDCMGSKPKQIAEPLYRAVIDCKHSIDADEITLHRNPKIPGNALRQLSDRLTAVATTKEQS